MSQTIRSSSWYPQSFLRIFKSVTKESKLFVGLLAFIELQSGHDVVFMQNTVLFDFFTTKFIFAASSGFEKINPLKTSSPSSPSS